MSLLGEGNTYRSRFSWTRMVNKFSDWSFSYTVPSQSSAFRGLALLNRSIHFVLIRRSFIKHFHSWIIPQASIKHYYYRNQTWFIIVIKLSSGRKPVVTQVSAIRIEFPKQNSLKWFLIQKNATRRVSLCMFQCRYRVTVSPANW